MVHEIRAVYHFTDDQILDHVELHGTNWVFESWKMIVEDRVRDWRMMVAVAPLSRTPMDKGGASAMTKYAKNLDKQLANALPWQRSGGRGLGDLRRKVKSGETVVMLDANDDKNSALFAGARMQKSSSR